MFSLNTIIPIIIAVTGSSGESRAVIVEPIDLMARISVRFAIIVDSRDINNMLPAASSEGIGISVPLIRLSPRQSIIDIVIT